MWHKEHQRHSQGPPKETAETAPKHSSVDLIGSQDSEILQVVEHIYRGKYTVAPSVFSCMQEEN